jgi:hypothetical protein
MKNNLIYIALILSAIAATFFVTKSAIKPEQKIVYRPDTVLVKADTVYRNKILFIKQAAKIDTITITRDNGDSMSILKATADTLIIKDSSRIKIKYYFPPANYFMIEIDLKERAITIFKEIYNTVKTDAPWYDHFWIGVSAVLVVVSGIFLLFTAV